MRIPSLIAAGCGAALLAGCGDTRLPGDTGATSTVPPAPITFISGVTPVSTTALRLTLPGNETPTEARIAPPGNKEALFTTFTLILPTPDLSQVPRFSETLSKQGCTTRVRGGVYARLLTVNTLQSSHGVYGNVMVNTSDTAAPSPEGVNLESAAYLYSDRDTAIVGTVTCTLTDGAQQVTRLDLNLKKGWNRAALLFRNSKADVTMYSSFALAPYVEVWAKGN